MEIDELQGSVRSCVYSCVREGEPEVHAAVQDRAPFMKVPTVLPRSHRTMQQMSRNTRVSPGYSYRGYDSAHRSASRSTWSRKTARQAIHPPVVLWICAHHQRRSALFALLWCVEQDVDRQRPAVSHSRRTRTHGSAPVFEVVGCFYIFDQHLVRSVYAIKNQTVRVILLWYARILCTHSVPEYLSTWSTVVQNAVSHVVGGAPIGIVRVYYERQVG